MKYTKRKIENAKILARCERPHQFVDISPETKLLKTYKCSKCNGTITQQNYIWYNIGNRDAKYEKNISKKVKEISEKSLQWLKKRLQLKNYP